MIGGNRRTGGFASAAAVLGAPTSTSKKGSLKYPNEAALSFPAAASLAVACTLSSLPTCALLITHAERDQLEAGSTNADRPSTNQMGEVAAVLAVGKKGPRGAYFGQGFSRRFARPTCARARLRALEGYTAESRAEKRGESKAGEDRRAGRRALLLCFFFVAEVSAAGSLRCLRKSVVVAAMQSRAFLHTYISSGYSSSSRVDGGSLPWMRLSRQNLQTSLQLAAVRECLGSQSMLFALP